MKCSTCNRENETSYFYFSGDWYCRGCRPIAYDGCRLFEYGHENKIDPKGSTAHVRDIKARRWHPTEKRMFYYEPPKTYFLPKDR